MIDPAYPSDQNGRELKEDATALGFDPVGLHRLLADVMNEKAPVHGIIVERHGLRAAEHYGSGRDERMNHFFAPRVEFGPTTLHDMRSIGKSIISLLVGIAHAQGRIETLQMPVIDFYPEYADSMTPEGRAITLGHLLLMNSGLQWVENGSLLDDEHRLMWKRSPSRFVLTRPLAAAPGSIFNYNSGGTAVLADILTRATGLHWKHFARTLLFEPLNITDWEWTEDIHGRPMSYTGLRMRPGDLAKIGRLVLDRGQWMGRQIVPAAWITSSTQPQMPTGMDNLQYGCHWWAGTVPWKGQSLAWTAAFGNGGQRLFIVPELDVTVVITAGAYNDITAARRVNHLFEEILSTAL